MKNFIKYTTIISIVTISSFLLLKKLKSEHKVKLDKEESKTTDIHTNGIVIKPKIEETNTTLSIVNNIRLKKGLPLVDENYNELNNDNDQSKNNLYFNNYKPKFYTRQD